MDRRFNEIPRTSGFAGFPNTHAYSVYEVAARSSGRRIRDSSLPDHIRQQDRNRTAHPREGRWEMAAGRVRNLWIGRAGARKDSEPLDIDFVFPDFVA